MTCSDDLGYHGLEHLACSINGVRERDLIEDSRRKGWVANLIPHEYVHSWCGKFRRPAGMCTDDFQTPLKTRLLWVYEGLTEYLGEVLMVQSGLIDAKEYRDSLTATIGSLATSEGRRWRTLEDTAAASYLSAGRKPELERAETRAGLLLREAWSGSRSTPSSANALKARKAWTTFAGNSWEPTEPMSLWFLTTCPRLSKI